MSQGQVAGAEAIEHPQDGERVVCLDALTGTVSHQALLDRLRSLWQAVPCGTSDVDKLYFEQYLFPRACRDLKAGVAHVPHWAPPLFTRGQRLVVTIHDLIPRLLPEYRGGLLARAYTALVSAATRGAARRKDISPKHFPVAISAITFSFLRMPTLPLSTEYIPPPGSPSLKITLPRS